MFIAMNRFRVAKGSEAAFEQVWASRDSHLDKVPGFVEFHLLKGPEAEDHTLYASHTIWTDKATFEAWTKSDAFRAQLALPPLAPKTGTELWPSILVDRPGGQGSTSSAQVRPR